MGHRRERNYQTLSELPCIPILLRGCILTGSNRSEAGTARNKTEKYEVVLVGLECLVVKTCPSDGMKCLQTLIVATAAMELGNFGVTWWKRKEEKKKKTPAPDSALLGPTGEICSLPRVRSRKR